MLLSSYSVNIFWYVHEYSCFETGENKFAVGFSRASINFYYVFFPISIVYQINDEEAVKKYVYYGGMDHSIRKEVKSIYKCSALAKLILVSVT